VRNLYIDSAFFIAWVDPADELHDLVLRIVDDLFQAPVRFITTDAVLFEVLAFFSRRGAQFRAAAARLSREVLEERTLECVHVDRIVMTRALDLYDRRDDKTYSLTDCVSMVVCRDRGITDVLTSDRDFEQEGFVRLLVD
jgi:predicted nucleic acid-binding protein